MESINKTAERIEAVQKNMKKEAAGWGGIWDVGKQLADDTVNLFSSGGGQRRFLQNADGVGRQEGAAEGLWNKIRSKANPENISSENLQMAGIAGGAGVAGAGLGAAANEADDDDDENEKNASNKQFFKRRI